MVRKMINNRISRIRTIILSLIFCFLCSSFIVSNLYCSEDSPYCSGDTDKIQELTDEFIGKYGEDVDIRLNEDNGIPRRIHGVYYSESEVDIKNPKGIASSFLLENASFLGMDMNDIKFKKLDERSDFYRVDFQQYYKGVPVREDEKIRINVYESVDGKIEIFLMSDYIPCIDLDVDPTISSGEAANIVKKDLGVSRLVIVEMSEDPYPYSNYYANPYRTTYYGSIYSPYYAPSPYSSVSPINWKEVPVEPELIIFPFEGDLYLAWKILCHDEPFRSYGPAYYYFIDAHTGEIIYNRSTAYGQTPSSGSNIYNPYITTYNPYDYNYTNTYNPYITTYNPYDFNYTNTYNPYTFPTSTSRFPGNLFNSLLSPSFINPILNYKGFYNNNFFPLSGGTYDQFFNGTNYFSPGNSYPFMPNSYYGLYGF